MVEKQKKSLIKVSFYAGLRDLFGIKKVIIFFFEEPTFRSLLKKIKKQIKKAYEIIDNEGNLRNNVMLCINGKLINFGDLDDFFLNDKDQVDLMPLPSGG
jgi:molybdopterin converting factor small subunit